MDLEALKRRAAEDALRDVRDGMRLGLGTGSTVAHFLEALGEALAAGELRDIVGVATSVRTEEHSARVGIPLATLEEQPALDLCIDGTDEVDPELNLIKGLGGALLREKMIAQSAQRFLVIADDTKRVQRLGEKAPLPIEVVPFAFRTHFAWLEAQGLRGELRCASGVEPYRTDNGNFIIDAYPGAGGFVDPAALADLLARRPGVVDHGFFLRLCDTVVLAGAAGITRL